MADNQINKNLSHSKASKESQYRSEPRKRLTKTHNSASIDGILMKQIRLFSVFPDGLDLPETGSNQSGQAGHGVTA